MSLRDDRRTDRPRRDRWTWSQSPTGRFDGGGLRSESSDHSRELIEVVCRVSDADAVDQQLNVPTQRRSLFDSMLTAGYVGPYRPMPPVTFSCGSAGTSLPCSYRPVMGRDASFGFTGVSFPGWSGRKARPFDRRAGGAAPRPCLGRRGQESGSRVPPWASTRAAKRRAAS